MVPANFKETDQGSDRLVKNINGFAYSCSNDKNWTMNFISEGCLPVTGYDCDYFYSTNPYYNEMIHPEDRNEVWEKIQQAVANKEHFQLTYRIITKDKSIKWLWEQGMCHSQNNGATVIIEGFVTDISHQIEAEERATHYNKSLSHEMKRKAIEFAELNHQIDRALQARNKIMAVISHDLHRSFNHLIIMAENIMKESPNLIKGNSNSYIREIYNTARSSYHLCENLLSWAKWYNGDLDFSVTSIALSDLILKVVDSMKMSMTSKNIHLVEDVEVGIKYNGDYIMMTSIIHNMIANGIKYSPDHGTLVIHAKQNEYEVVFQVNDSGVKVGEKNRPNVFETRESPHNVAKDLDIGPDLGLTLVKEFIKYHQGNMEVKSSIHEGTSFIMHLPQRPPLH